MKFSLSSLGRLLVFCLIWCSLPSMLLGTTVAEAQASDPVPIGSLLSQADDHPDMQTVRGVVTHTGSPFYLQDNSGGVEVTAGSIAAALRVGDEVEIVGKLTLGRYSAKITATSLRVLRVSVPHPPLSVTPALAASGSYDRQFVETVGTLVSSTRQDGRLVLLLRNTHQIFTAEQSSPSTTHDEMRWETGSLLKVRGVCLMTTGTSPIPVPFHLLLRSSQDIEVLAGPPFWTSNHVLLLSVCLILIGVAVLLAWTRLERWRFGVILNERMRMAHDLHDTLAQSFAGIAFQLHAVTACSASDRPIPPCRSQFKWRSVWLPTATRMHAGRSPC